MVQAFAHVSGAHLNPAVTPGMWLSGHVPRRRVAGYVAAQLVGAVAASLCLHALFGMTGRLGATIPRLGDPQALAFEAVTTLILVEAILGTADSGTPQGVAALLIGATVFLDAVVGGPVSGASMNPARSARGRLTVARGGPRRGDARGRTREAARGLGAPRWRQDPIPARRTALQPGSGRRAPPWAASS